MYEIIYTPDNRFIEIMNYSIYFLLLQLFKTKFMENNIHQNGLKWPLKTLCNNICVSSLNQILGNYRCSYLKKKTIGITKN